MAEYIRADKQLIVAVFGITTTLITGILLGFIEAKSGHAIYSWMFWFIIPVGAILSGFGAASGYYLGAVSFHQKPAGGVLLNMIGASIAAFFIIHYIPYFMLTYEGVRIKDVISFWQFLDIDIRSTSLSFMRGSTSTGELGGFWGYALSFLQLLGFAFGGACVFGWLTSKPYCEECSRYMKKVGNQKRYTSEGETLIEKITKFASIIDTKNCREALSFHAENMGVVYGEGHHLESNITISRCSGCGKNLLDFVVSKRNGNDWKEIEEVGFKVLTEEQLKPDDKSSNHSDERKNESENNTEPNHS